MRNLTVSSTTKEIEEKLSELTEKYFHLVWYARKAPSDDKEYWDGTPDEIKTKALNEVSRIEEFFPDDVDELVEDESNWTHGFNSGCLAAFRFVQTAIDTKLHEVDDEDTWEDDTIPDGTKMVCFGGIEQAEEEFPFLDT